MALLAGACGMDSAPSPDPAVRGVESRPAIKLSTAATPAAREVVPLLERTLDANRSAFEGHTGLVEGFGAGGSYPQIWLRDSATLLPFARYLHPRNRLGSWLEEHLAHQKRSGELWDWIAAGRPDQFAHGAPQCEQVYRAGSTAITADKNSSAADQEASAVHAAFQFVNITGDVDWLLRPLFGRAVLDRLEAALLFLFRERFDPRLGLVTSALTADWGDVSPVYADQRATYLDDATPVVGGLYVNVVAYRAAREMAFLQERAGRPENARDWAARAQELRRAIRRHLWQPGRGFFRMHVPSSDPPSSFDASHIFALGGNALAVRTGVATPAEAARIFAVAEQRRRSHGLSTVAAVLLPPFPRGFFAHPLLAEEYTYQNGGQWDWWAGPFVLAEFEGGNAQAAQRHLAQILERVRRSRKLFEWSTRDDEGRGSRLYAGSAASVGAVLVEGAFGVKLRHDRLDIWTRACEKEASIDLHQPATGGRVAYRCGPSPGGLVLRFETAGVEPGRLCVLLPAERTLREGRIDGSGARVAIEVVGEDTYACVETSWGHGELSLLLGPGPAA